MNIFLSVYLVVGVLIYIANLGYTKHKVYGITVGLILIPFWLFTILYYFGAGMREEIEKK